MHMQRLLVAGKYLKMLMKDKEIWFDVDFPNVEEGSLISTYRIMQSGS